jgi:SAM-dependent methyltransferase
VQAIVNCPICDSNEYTFLSRTPDYEYRSLPEEFTMLQCTQCGHGYLEDPPSPEQLPVIYPSTYYTVNKHSPIHFGDFIHKQKIRRDVKRILSLAKGHRLKSIVDLGCGDAERLAQIGEGLGGAVELIGVDFQPDVVREEALRSRGVRLVDDNIEGKLDELRDGGHDLIVSCQTLEHLYNPAASLKTVAQKLAPGGLLLIETPNKGGLDFILFKQRYWGFYHTPRHFHVFTTDSLSRTVEQSGLSVVKQGFIPSGSMILSLRNALGLNSVARGPRFGEFISNKNIMVVGASGVLDLLLIALGLPTSNQYILATKVA